MQQVIDFEAARSTGDTAANACADKAARVADFDREGAGRFILGYLRRHGETPGEILTEQAIAHGYRVHDSRAFGAVYAKLNRDKLIRCTGYCMRKNGHGTAGGRIWAAVL